jgi:hypothetical protein
LLWRVASQHLLEVQQRRAHVLSRHEHTTLIALLFAITVIVLCQFEVS